MTDRSPLLARNRAHHPEASTPAYRSTQYRAPNQPLLKLPSMPTEETGPVFGNSLLGPLDNDLIRNYSQGRENALGERILVHGRVIDQNERPVVGALIEVWQANAGGRYRHIKDGYFAPLDPNFGGCGRCITDDAGHYSFMTIKPGAYPWPNGGNDWRPMHIHFSLFGHAFGQRLITQMYFEGDPLVAMCPIAKTVGSQTQIDRLVAPLDMSRAVPMDHLAYRFDIVLRGRDQTMFENKPEGMWHECCETTIG